MPIAIPLHHPDLSSETLGADLSKALAAELSRAPEGALSAEVRESLDVLAGQGGALAKAHGATGAGAFEVFFDADAGGAQVTLSHTLRSGESVAVGQPLDRAALAARQTARESAAKALARKLVVAVKGGPGKVVELAKTAAGLPATSKLAPGVPRPPGTAPASRPTTPPPPKRP